MASKKGVVITAIILGAITASSFMVWMLPQDNMQITVSDFGLHIAGVENIHRVLYTELDDSFAKLLAGDITAEQYVEIAETASSQVNVQIIQLVESQAPEQWHESYIAYIEALKVQNSIIRETIVAADAVKDGDAARLGESESKIEVLKNEMEQLIMASEASIPVTPEA